ncbi:TPA: host cell division inhibitor Icd-like protein [Escherichia coli]|nr:host cell division inhibitor Icd-like protein [Escherichia coli]HAW7408819.1 host cell division inhibitor Icd-like protein [Escherichia coli]
MTHKTKATWGGRQFGNTKHKHGNDSLYQAGGQCYQSVSVRCHNCEALSFDEYSLRYFSRAKEHGANRSDSCSFFLRRLFRAGDVFSVDSSLVIVCACKAMRRSSSHHGADSDYSDSLALRRWRRFISPRMAVTINCASVSFSSFTKFISLKTSRGTLAVFCCDLLFVVPVGISVLLTVRWCSVYGEKKIKKDLKCKSPKSNLDFKVTCTKKATPLTVGPVTGRLTTNDSNSIEVAMLNHITHPQGRDSHNLNKFTWRFMQCLTDSIAIFTVTAATEREARAQLPHAHLIFVARIRQGETYAQ